MKQECVKCGYIGNTLNKHGLNFCNVCHKFCPNSPEETDEYIQEKANKDSLNPFRKYSSFRGQTQKKGMILKASNGKVMSRAAFGYNIRNKKLVPAENADEVLDIFEEFLEKDITLNKLAKKHNLSVNGLKKILSNFTYIGKIKFNNEIHEGNHKAIISPILFNKVQDKLEKIRKK